MTAEERQMLGDLAGKIAQTPPPPIDPEAQEFIRANIGSRPDALYLMTQTVLIQNIALDQARQQIEQLRKQTAAAPSPSSSFLGNAGGIGAQRTAAPAGEPGSGGFFSSGGGSGFLRSAAQTAAGVAAGALAFEGIRSLFGGLEHLAGFGGPQYGSGLFGGMGGFGNPQPEETVINNYYDSPSGAESRDNFHSDTHYRADANTGFDNSSDLADEYLSGDSSGNDDFGDDGGGDFSGDDSLS